MWVLFVLELQSIFKNRSLETENAAEIICWSLEKVESAVPLFYWQGKLGSTPAFKDTLDIWAGAASTGWRWKQSWNTYHTKAAVLLHNRTAFMDVL